MNSPAFGAGSRYTEKMKKAKNKTAKGNKNSYLRFEERKESVPVTQTIATKQRPVSISSVRSPDNRIVVRHKEFVCDVTGEIGYRIDTNIAINPGLAEFSPWLQNIAYNYECYRFRSLEFLYIPTSSATTNGRVMMMVDYDAADSPPLSKQTFMANHSAVAGAPWQPITLKLDAADMHKLPQRYHRYGALAANLDVKTYDMGRLFLAVSNFAASGQVCGELHIRYEVEMITPQLLTGEEALSESKVLIAAGVVDKAHPLGTTPVVTGGLPLSNPTATTIEFPEPGEHILSFEKVGTGLITTVMGGYANATLLSAIVNAAGTSALENWKIKIDGAGPDLVFDTSGDTTLTAAKVRIGEFSYLL